jgi:hypothetical protein
MSSVPGLHASSVVLSADFARPRHLRDAQSPALELSVRNLLLFMSAVVYRALIEVVTLHTFVLVSSRMSNYDAIHYFVHDAEPHESVKMVELMIWIGLEPRGQG